MSLILDWNYSTKNAIKNHYKFKIINYFTYYLHYTMGEKITSRPRHDFTPVELCYNSLPLPPHSFLFSPQLKWQFEEEDKFLYREGSLGNRSSAVGGRQAKVLAAH